MAGMLIMREGQDFFAWTSLLDFQRAVNIHDLFSDLQMSLRKALLLTMSTVE